jgi:TolB-like protein
MGRTILTLMALMPLVGCGYHFKGAGLTAPSGVQTIAVTVFENKTSESGIETVFTGDLAYEFTRSKVLQVVDKERADAVLSGSIVSVSVDTIVFTDTYASDERRVTVTLNLVLTRKDGKVLWANSALSDNEIFKVSDKLTTERNRRAAIEVMSERLAEKVHTRILEDF